MPDSLQPGEISCVSQAPAAVPARERQQRVAIVHYWLVGMRGGEKVLEALCELYPDADIFTHVYWPERISATIRRHKVTTSLIARLPMARRFYTHYLPLMPFALEQFDLTAYDLVISSESGPTKGVLTNAEALHVCYCHTPMRYAWSGYHRYLERANPVMKLVMLVLLSRIRQWDLASSFRVDHFIANSRNVALRIEKYYHRQSAVVYPPVETTGHDLATPPEDFYLLVGQLVPYKGTELVIEAFNRLGRRLLVIGHGTEMRRLRRMAGPDVTMLGWQDSAAVRSYYARCRALVFAADEDFGMVPVEAMSAGRPIIALRRGGALETVVAEQTGVFFDEPTVDSLIAAVLRFEAIEPKFDRTRIAAHAQQFSKAAFHERIAALMTTYVDAHSRRQSSVDATMAARFASIALPTLAAAE